MVLVQSYLLLDLSLYEMIQRNNYDVIADGCIEGKLQTGPTKDKIEQAPFQGSIMNFVNNAGRVSSPRGIYDCPDKDDGQVELVILFDGRYYIKTENGIKKIDLRSVTKPYGNDEKVIIATQKKLSDTITQACSFSETQKLSLLKKGKELLHELLLEAINDCRTNKGKQHKSCKVLEMRKNKVQTQVSTGVRD